MYRHKDLQHQVQQNKVTRKLSVDANIPCISNLQSNCTWPWPFTIRIYHGQKKVNKYANQKSTDFLFDGSSHFSILLATIREKIMYKIHTYVYSIQIFDNQTEGQGQPLQRLLLSNWLIFFA